MSANAPAPIIVEQTVRAPAARIWRALADTAEMRQWYFKIAALEPQPGWPFQFYGGSEKSLYLHQCKIIEAIPNARLSHTWTYEIFPGCNTLVTWELFSESENKTRVRLTHAGVDGFPKTNPDFARASFVAGWTYIVRKSLKQFVEK